MRPWTKLAAILVVSGVTLYVAYRCYKYGRVERTGDKSDKKDKKEEGNRKTIREASSPADGSKMSKKKRESGRARLPQGICKRFFSRL